MRYESKFNIVVISSSIVAVILVLICGLIITNCSTEESLYRVMDNSIESAIDSEVASIPSEVSKIVNSIKPREDSEQSIVSKVGVNKEHQVVSHTFIDNTSKVQQSSEEDIFQMSLPIKIVEPPKHIEASQVSSRGTEPSETSKVSSGTNETSEVSNAVNETSKVESRGTATSEVSSSANETSKIESSVIETSEILSGADETSDITETSEAEQSQSSYEESIEPLDYVRYAYFDYDFEQSGISDIPDNYEVNECYKEWGMTKLDNIDGTYTFDEIIDVFNVVTLNDCQVADYDTVCAYFNDKMASDSAFARQMYMSDRADILLENGVFRPQSRDITTYTIIPNMFSRYVVHTNQEGVGNFDGGIAFYFYSKQEDKQGYIDEFKTVLKGYLQDGISETGYKYIYSCFRDGQLMICMFNEFDYIGEAKG